MPLVVVTTSPRVAPGLLSHQAWQAFRSGPVLTGSPDHPQLPYLAEAGVEVAVVTPDPAGLVARAAGETVVWLAADGDEDFMRALGHAAIALGDPPLIEVVPGSYDLPGARVLDLVRVMDRLRTECPWDRKQTHESLVPYLLEEAYEVLETIEEGDHDALREELGDLLLQVVFHARVAEGFDVGDVADGIVGKLVRRHPPRVRLGQGGERRRGERQLGGDQGRRAGFPGRRVAARRGADGPAGAVAGGPAAAPRRAVGRA
ncbi:MazG nucleotide pyrophosphohydrolase domain-containing protein [Nonomuraea ferruginea]